MKTKDFIEMIQKLDPTGEKDVIVEHEGIGFDVMEGQLNNCKEGVLDDGEECVVIPTMT